MSTTADDGPTVTELPHGYRLVVGLEVHVELHTATKLFCGCPNQFGDEPNTNVCPVCLGLPGSMPVLNAQAMELAMRLGRALHCEVRPSVFARKNYFYPDMPKDYQVSQYDQPTNVDGHLDLPDGTRIGIERAHIEEDTGKSTHVGGGGRIHDAAYSLVDYNRCGVPLVEIVSRPDFRTADQAKAYVERAARHPRRPPSVSDAKMEEGSLRVDANVSVHQPDTPFGTRCEIKNINSVRSLGRAIEYEALRQVDLLESGERVIQQTRHWNEDEGRTHMLRSKEEAEDYRYFPEPDLVPDGPRAVAASPRSTPPCPACPPSAALRPGRRHRPHAARRVGHDRRRPWPRRAGPRRHRRRRRRRPHPHPPAARPRSPGRPQRLGRAPRPARARWRPPATLTASQAKQVVAEMGETGKAPDAIAAERGFEAMDTSELEAIVDEAIAANADAWDKYCAGEQKAQGAIVGHVMKATRGQADGKAVTRILEQRRSA